MASKPYRDFIRGAGVLCGLTGISFCRVFAGKSFEIFTSGEIRRKKKPRQNVS